MGAKWNSSSRNFSQARDHSPDYLLQETVLKVESLSWLCLLSMWIKALLLSMRFLRTQTGNSRIWSDWKCNGLLLWVVLTLSGPEEAL